MTAHRSSPAARDSAYQLREAGEAMLVSFYSESHKADYHFSRGIEHLHKAAAALGYRLTPLPSAPEPAPATAEALFEVAA